MTTELQEIIATELKKNGYYPKIYPNHNDEIVIGIYQQYEQPTAFGQALAILLINNSEIEIIDAYTYSPHSRDALIITLADPQSIPKLLGRINTISYLKEQHQLQTFYKDL